MTFAGCRLASHNIVATPIAKTTPTNTPKTIFCKLVSLSSTRQKLVLDPFPSTGVLLKTCLSPAHAHDLVAAATSVAEHERAGLHSPLTQNPARSTTNPRCAPSAHVHLAASRGLPESPSGSIVYALDGQGESDSHLKHHTAVRHEGKRRESIAVGGGVHFLE